jgi:hypothetical protein
LRSPLETSISNHVYGTNLQDGIKDGNLPERPFHSVSTQSRSPTSPSESPFHLLPPISRIGRVRKGGKLMNRMAICFALQGGTILLVFIVALTITDTNYGKEDTVVPPVDLVKTVGEKNAVHAGPGARQGREGGGEGDDEVTVTGTGPVGEMMSDQSGKKY